MFVASCLTLQAVPVLCKTIAINRIQPNDTAPWLACGYYLRLAAHSTHFIVPAVAHTVVA